MTLTPHAGCHVFTVAAAATAASVLSGSEGVGSWGRSHDAGVGGLREGVRGQSGVGGWRRFPPVPSRTVAPGATHRTRSPRGATPARTWQMWPGTAGLWRCWEGVASVVLVVVWTVEAWNKGACMDC